MVKAMIYESIVKRRTIRKFTQKAISPDILRKCVDAARLSPSGMNYQPLKYLVVTDSALLAKVFTNLTWARNIPGYSHASDEVPTAYIIILLDTTIREHAGSDPGIAAMSISMVAYEAGLGSCILGSVDRPQLKKQLKIPDQLQVLLVIALGYPREQSKETELQGSDTRYWFDNRGVLNIPKRRLRDIIIWNTFNVD
jgi:nitroreductase